MMFYSVVNGFCYGNYGNMVHIYIVIISMVLLLFRFGISEDNIHVDGYFSWTHEDFATTDLLCPECCKEERGIRCFPIYADFSKDRKTICCARKAKPYWKFYEYFHLWPLINLQVIYDLSTGKAFVHDNLLGFFGHFGNSTFYDLDHNNGRLSSFPENICQFPAIVMLNVSKNFIRNVTDLGCLNKLDTLDISYNRLTAIESFTFTNLSYLRYLNLSNNLITSLEPGTFKFRPRSLIYVDFSYNRLLSIDITNVVLGYIFKAVNYSHNLLSKLTNLSKWKGFKKGDRIGGGWFLVHFNNFSRIFNPSMLRECGFENIHSVFKVAFNYYGALNNNPWICDCLSYPFINICVQAHLHFKGMTGIICMQPTYLQGYSVKDFLKNKQLLHKLTCTVSMKQKCPPKCSCFKQPSKNRVVVNCSYSDLSKMPKIVPELDNLHIDLSKNKIQVFQNLDYLKRTIQIDLSQNRIRIIDPKVFTIQKLDIIHLNKNLITSLYRSIQFKSPCKLRLGHLQLPKCKCEMHWVKLWLEKQSLINCRANVNIITCKYKDMPVNLTDMSENELCPPITRENTTYIWFVVITFFLLLLMLLYLLFRYEIFLILRHFDIHLHRRNIDRKIVYDVYLSFNADNNDVRQWTSLRLVSYLENHGYKVCLPPRDFVFGGIHCEQIHDKIGCARSFLIVLSEDYFKSQFQAIEWIHIWEAFRMDINSQLVIINHDILTNKDLHDRKLKAFLRFGYSLDFSDFKNTLLVEIEKRLKITLARRYGKQTTCL